MDEIPVPLQVLEEHKEGQQLAVAYVTATHTYKRR